MRKRVLIILMAMIPFFAISQNVEITGKVIGESDNQPIPGVTVVIKGSTTGTITDIDGIYKISAKVGDVLLFSFVGLENQEIAVTGATTIDVTMKSSMIALDELVVVGYGVQKKSLVTGSISKVNSEKLIATQPQRVEQALQGKVSGVTIASESGSPGAGMTIRIRGTSSNRNTSPLFIVDGMKTGGIDYLDPADIASVEILKDAASAAIYGAEGGNGVVLITTKKGSSGRTEVTYSAYVGTQRYVDKLKVLDANQYIDYYQKATEYEIRAKYPTNTEEKIQSRIHTALAGYGLPQIGETYNGPNTDWLNEVTNPAPMVSHNLNLSGGNEKSTYSASVNYFNQDGITGGSKSNFKRWTARVNLEMKANDYITVGAKATYSRRERSSLAENSEFGGVFGNALMIDPLTPTIYETDDSIPAEYMESGNEPYFVRNNDGKAYGMSRLVKNEIVNPLAQVQRANGNFGEDKILAGAFAQIEPIKGLKYKSSFDVDVANSMTENYSQPTYYHNLNNSAQSRAYQEQNNYHTWQWENTLSYNKTIDQHTFSLLAGTAASEYKYNQLTGTGYDLVDYSYDFSHPADAQNLSTPYYFVVNGNYFQVTGGDTIPVDTVGSVAIPVDANGVVGGSRTTPRRLASLFGRLEYNYAEKYMLNVTIRNDKSSLLSPKKREGKDRAYQSGIFPSASIGWVVSNEDFWTVSVVDFLKVRYSYGTNGSLSTLNPWEYVPLIGYSGNPLMDASGNVLQGTVPTRLSNDMLQWEYTAMHNAGVDFRFLNSKFSGSIDYFKKTTENLIDLKNTPGYAGNNKPMANVGTVENKGIEFELSYKQFEGDFQYEIGGNLSFMKNEITEFPNGANGANLGVGGAVTRIDVGEPIYYFYGYKTDGVWKDQAQIDAENYYVDETGASTIMQARVQPGDIKVVDVNNDHKINTDDRTNIGTPHPKVIAGLNINANYKGFDLSMNLLGNFGQQIYMGIYRNDVGLSNRPAHFYTEAWSPTNTGAEMYRPTTSSAWNFAHNDQYIESGSFVKLKNVQIGYTIPMDLTKKIQISKIRLYVSGNNLLTISKYRGSDPEIGNTAGLASYGVDRGFYPQARQFLAGINVTF